MGIPTHTNAVESDGDDGDDGLKSGGADVF